MRRLSDWNSQTFANWLIAIVLVGVPFQGFLTVWGSSLVGHYTLLRLWDDVLLLLVSAVVCGWIATDRQLRRRLASSLLMQLLLAYAALTLVLGAVSLAKGEVTAKALAYGVLINLRFLAWFLAVLVTAERSAWLKNHWRLLVLWPAAVVVVFAVLQFTVLPHDFLAHFGYNAHTNIAPIETINHNSRYIRVQSTTRGANPLGAYLVIIVSALAALFLAAKRHRLAYVVAGVVTLFALYGTGSRSAWVGTVLGLATIAWLSLRTRRSRVITGVASLVILALAASLFLLFKNDAGLQNAIFHTQAHSRIKVGSDTAHASALRTGLHDVLHQPFGDGPGTAGPASEYNGAHPARIAENYYVQIAQETGWLGVALLLSILVLVARELYARIGVSPLALILFASLIGVSFVNLLSHAWVDDTLAYLWWGLAGIALSLPLQKAKKT